MAHILLRGAYLKHNYYIAKNLNAIEGFIITPNGQERKALQVIRKYMPGMDISYQGQVYVAELMNGELDVHLNKLPAARKAFYFSTLPAESGEDSLFELNDIQNVIDNLIWISKKIQSTKASGLVV